MVELISNLKRSARSLLLFGVIAVNVYFLNYYGIKKMNEIVFIIDQYRIFESPTRLSSLVRLLIRLF